jgi:hypothetical protein
VPARVLQVERDRALVAVEVDAVEAVARPAQAVGGARRFHPDDVCAPIGEVAHAGRAGAGEGEIQHAQAGQGQARSGGGGGGFRFGGGAVVGHGRPPTRAETRAGGRGAARPPALPSARGNTRAAATKDATIRVPRRNRAICPNTPGASEQGRKPARQRGREAPSEPRPHPPTGTRQNTATRSPSRGRAICPNTPRSPSRGRAIRTRRGRRSKAVASQTGRCSAPTRGGHAFCPITRGPARNGREMARRRGSALCSVRDDYNGGRRSASKVVRRSGSNRSGHPGARVSPATPPNPSSGRWQQPLARISHEP